ncbi:MAG: diadenylate cyclase CdaA [Candidatus Omnitrophica bacterium]|nr:diadenylate cyclase CdaA [Candidatus Omnitrophota bacterium]
MNILNLFHFWKPVLEIITLWFIIYHIMLFFEGTRAIYVLRGIMVILITFFVFQKLKLDVLSWLLTKLFTISVIALLVIFHPEIRQGLARLGKRRIFPTLMKEEQMDYILNQIIKAVDSLMRDKFGALIAIENKDSLSSYINNGVLIDARVSSELIQAIFTPNNPLHDGGIIIQNGRIMAAGCFFPFTENEDLSRIFGMRHRAGLGLTEETDAIVIIVSEERQNVSLVHQGRLYKDLGHQEIIAKVKEIFKA